MDYKKFIEKLPQLYKRWGKASAQPLTEIYNEINHQIGANSSTSIMQLLNWALQCMNKEEIYCQIDAITASDVIGALINHPQIAYLVAQPTDNHQQSEVLFELTSAVSLYNLDEQIILTEQPAAEFFGELRQISPKTKIGVYVYAGAHDYRSQLLALQLVKPLLAPQALIIAFGSKYSTAQQAHWDFLTTTPQAQLLLELPATVQNTWGEGIQIFSWDIEQDYSYDGSDLTENHRSQIVIEALRNTCEQLELQTLPQRLLNLEQQALQLEINQQFIPAVEIYQQIIQLQPNHADAYYHLGIINEQMQRYSQAHEMLLRSISIDDTRTTYHYSLGLVSEKLGLVGQAIEAYQTAINLDTQWVNAYNNLGNILVKIGEIEQAKLIYQQAIANNPNHFGSYLNLANLLIYQQQVDAAIENYQKSLQLNPNYPDIMNNLGLAFAAKNDKTNSYFYLGCAAYYRNKYLEAIQYFRDILDIETEHLNIYNYLVQCYTALNLEDNVIETYQQAIAHYPNERNLYLNLIVALQNADRVEDAIAVAIKASKTIAENFIFKLEEQRLLPVIYETVEEIEFYRTRFSNKLDALIAETSLETVAAKQNVLKGLEFRTNYHLHRQCQNDLELQKKSGQLIHKIMVANYPEYHQFSKISSITTKQKIKVGYVSANFRNNSGAKWLLGWMKHHPKNQFEISCYHLGVHTDFITQDFKIYSEVFYHFPEDIELAGQQIIKDQLHILVYPDICQNPKSNQMAALRLAPIQCTSWGHPVTSGLPTIDYYLSSELMEPDNGEEHYSEKLVRLPNIGVCYPQSVLPTSLKKRADFSLEDDALVYLSCQSLFKYLPQHDYIFAAIAKCVPQSQFVFIKSDISEAITRKLHRRLQKAFASFGLKSEEYCVMVPPLNQVDYLNLNLVSDVFLDTLGWSGGNTTLEAISCNLPIVTCPGEFMRGRHSYGILQMLGVTETIASSEAEYIEIAVRLGLEQEWRESIINKIKQNQKRVYEDQTCVVALEEFYQRVVHEHLINSY
ncbi:Tetratricopeptide TPR_1 repeat-containing protein [Crinalium epipsammum PCC 9333]|uniref:protein O-GlcNAc transferase n=1 Tax=Crinalium epipsammum PCC 9333 TaxID=1173022 RepID=K9W352_9CYAN|nr:glycosyltransferase family 41 protein [Crinalium epipsammum]AFZ14219.1 Tetratricopeptide TPR_1 repeat-containing protein [Crinalium epipsammum PCC 9333]